MGEWIRRLWYLLNRRRFDDGLRAEMEAHREMMREPARFGATLRLRDEARDAWGWGWLDGIVRDLRLGARALRRTPVFTVAAIASLAIGLALAASTTSVVNAYLIRSLPYPAADRVYHVRYAPPGPWEPAGMSGLNWASLQDVVEFPMASLGETLYLNTGEYTLPLRALRIRPGFVEGFGMGVAAGRNVVERDFAPGGERVALIGHAIWRDRFGSDPTIIGRLIRVDTESRPDAPETFRVVGVIASGFHTGNDRAAVVELLVPSATPVRAYMARLREGVTPAAAERRLTEAARSAATSPIPDTWPGVQLESARERRLGGARAVLYGVAAAVALVLVIVCANLAVLMLLRAMQRQREVAIRLALGSGRRHIARMLLAESSVICAVAFGLGLTATAVSLDALAPQVEAQLGRQALSASGIAIDANVVLIVAGISMLIAVALSLLPLTSWGRSLTDALRQDERTATEGRSMRRLRGGLVAFEVAGSLVLLIGCGLMIRSVMTLVSTDLGFNPDQVYTSRIMLRARNYSDASPYRGFHERFAASVSTAAGAPVVFSTWPLYVAPPTHAIRSDGSEASAGAIAVSAQYFAALHVPIRQGREFTPDEAAIDAPVAIVSERLAERLWPGRGALGQRVRQIQPTPQGLQEGPWRDVVGVAGNVRQQYDDAELSDFYTPKTPDGRFGTFYVRTPRSGSALFDQLQRAAGEIDREAVINPPRLVASADQTMAGSRFLTGLLSTFAGIAAFLAMLGLYGVTAYAVQQRRKEMAIRTALGASGRAVLEIFLRDGGLAIGAGAGAGLLGGVLLSRVLQNLVLGVPAFDLATFAMACALLVSAGFAAVLWAARRALRTDPAASLNGN